VTALVRPAIILIETDVILVTEPIHWKEAFASLLVPWIVVTLMMINSIVSLALHLALSALQLVMTNAPIVTRDILYLMATVLIV
jgi:hypothetical protein